MTPSSEEIAAALHALVETHRRIHLIADGMALPPDRLINQAITVESMGDMTTTWGQQMREAFPEWMMETLAAHRTTLRSHLSRLREEARFRDAAMAYAKFYWPGKRAVHGRFAEPFAAAARALEEPRDA